MAAGLGAQRRSVEEILWEHKSLRVGGGGDDGGTGSFAVARRKKHREGKHFLRKGKNERKRKDQSFPNEYEKDEKTHTKAKKQKREQGQKRQNTISKTNSKLSVDEQCRTDCYVVYFLTETACLGRRRWDSMGGDIDIVSNGEIYIGSDQS
ncbi:hypothetical protein L484_019532 [Morus notabilis]|uniref:Uncharacterized protein n=1 Tax=Morus notabilis TaxID=981085 RepID=W9RE45_9ROSA|nr:hypothetical protein L484_019532 [Morus notabilis]